MTAKDYRGLFYLSYILLVYVFWFFYGWRSVVDFKSAFKVFLFATPYLIGFWFNRKFLFNSYFIKGKTGKYFLFTVLSFLCLYIIQNMSQLDSLFDIDKLFGGFTAFLFLRDILISQMTFMMFCGLGMTFSFVENWIESAREIENLKSEKLKAELTSLKNQLSPHFLFNTLNMVHILTKTNPPAASEVSMELSELLRYQLYGASKEIVYLREEIGFIQNLLKIEKLRKSTLRLRVNIEVLHANVTIQPLILAPLVENALKHGSGNIESAEISMNLKCSNAALFFRISNKFVDQKTNNEINEKGTGLINLRRRLELSYPGRFSLNTEVKNDDYVAELTIKEL